MVSENLPALAAIAHGRDTLTTEEAAPTINRRPQTLRKWACLENGPIRPIRINGRLAWRARSKLSLVSAVPTVCRSMLLNVAASIRWKRIVCSSSGSKSDESRI